MTPREALERGARQLGLSLEAETCERLLAYVTLMAKWNKTYNLTALRDPLAVVSHHLLDSLAVLPHLSMPAAGSLADVGSGAGLPGIPLAIARRDWRVVLVEASQKKAAFLRQATIELSLRNTSVHDGRVEAFQPGERFAVVISRAFARLAQFARACAHLVANGGCLAAMKGALREDELVEMREWRCTGIKLDVPLLDAARHLIICRRTSDVAAT
jgi:16S rRNA (guanine527-N7)-methyltransferase